MSHKLSHSQIFLRGIHCRLAVTPQTAPALAVMFGADSVAQGSQSVPCGRPTWFLRLSQKVLCGIRIGFFHCRIVSRRNRIQKSRGLPQECIFRAGRAQPLWLRSAGVGWAGLGWTGEQACNKDWFQRQLHDSPTQLYFRFAAAWRPRQPLVILSLSSHFVRILPLSRFRL